MNMAAMVTDWRTVVVEGSGNGVRLAWDRLSPLPGGKRVFSALLGRMAPYSGSVGAQVVELERGHSKVLLTDRHEVRNHLRSIHAIALVNVAEIAGNLCLAYSLPDDARFIVAGLSIDYLKKARGQVVCECRMPPIETSARSEHAVPVEMKDSSETLVARCTLRTLVGPKKGLG
jgi:acyl-coenzyme A thioesterase PaaI-like protein